jgi:hypothetical protein
MKVIVDGTETMTKKVGGSKYGYLYLPKEWIGSTVTVVKHEKHDTEKPSKESKQILKMKLYAKKRLKKDGYNISVDSKLQSNGVLLTPLLYGTKKDRIVIISATANEKVVSKDINERLSSASNVMYLVIKDDARLSDKAKGKIKELGNVKIWRFSK